MPVADGGGEAARLIRAHSHSQLEVQVQATETDELNVVVIPPSRRHLPAKCTRKPTSPAACVAIISFTPEEVGTHLIEVRIGTSPPVTSVVKVYDAGLIRVTDIQPVVLGHTAHFKVDASAAGEGQLEISINDGEVPNQVQVVGGGRCIVRWRAEAARSHSVDIRFNGEPVPGSPFRCEVLPDLGQLALDIEEAELVCVGSRARAVLRPGEDNNGELEVSVKGPQGDVPVTIQKRSLETGSGAAGEVVVEWVPWCSGPHTLHLTMGGRTATATCRAFDPRLVSVAGAPGTVSRVGRPTKLTVDAARAGEGNLDISVAAKGVNVPTQVHPLGNARFTVTFVPTEAVDHVVNVTFNKMVVPNCPLVMAVVPGESAGSSASSTSGGAARGARITLPGPVPLHTPATILIHHPTARLEDIEVNVEGGVPAAILPSSEGAQDFRAEFTPIAAQEHKINISICGDSVNGSPFLVKVYDVSAIKVRDAPVGTVGKPVTFLVETSQAGPGNLEVTVNGGRVATTATAHAPHTYAISFTPLAPVAHTVQLKFNGHHVPGSPFTTQVSAAACIVNRTPTDSTPVKGATGEQYSFIVESPTAPVVDVLGPARKVIPTQVVPIVEADGTEALSNKYSCSFVPEDVGDHSIEVKTGTPSSHVTGSPFLLKAYSAQRVLVTNIQHATVNTPVNFTIDASAAGAGNLEIIVAVNGRNVPNYVQSEGNARFKVNFKPTEALPHTLSVRFNGKSVPGSPFTCPVSSITPSSSPLHQGQVSPQPGHSGSSVPSIVGDVATAVRCGVIAELKLTGFDGASPQVSVMAPNSQMVESSLKKMESSGKYSVTFKPRIVGRHTVNILYGGLHIKGSPLQMNAFDVDKVLVEGLGKGTQSEQSQDLSLDSINLEDSLDKEPEETEDAVYLQVGSPHTFKIDASKAGEGTLELVVSTLLGNTVKAEVSAVSRGLYSVSFTPVCQLPHRVTITFNETPVPHAPYLLTHLPLYTDIGAPFVLELPSEVDEALVQVSTVPTKVNQGQSSAVPFHITDRVLTFVPKNAGPYQIKCEGATSGGGDVLLAVVRIVDVSALKLLSVSDPALVSRPVIIAVNIEHTGTELLTCICRSGGLRAEYSIRSRGPRIREIILHCTRAAPYDALLMLAGRRALSLSIDVHHPLEDDTVVAARGAGLYYAVAGRPTHITVTANNNNNIGREIDVVAAAPGGGALPVRCYQTRAGELRADFIPPPKQNGEANIEVLHLSRHVTGSPFICRVVEPSAVKLRPPPVLHAPYHLHPHEPLLLQVDCSEAGPGVLDCWLEGGDGLASHGALQVIETDQLSWSVTLVPKKIGHYNLHLTYEGVPVASSPLSIGVSNSSPSHINSATIDGSPVSNVHIGKEASFFIKTDSKRKPIVEMARVRTDSDLSWGAPEEECEAAVAREAGGFRVALSARAAGLFLARVSCGRGGGPLAGSPRALRLVDAAAAAPPGGWPRWLAGTDALRAPAKLLLDVSRAGPAPARDGLQALLASRRCKVEQSGEKAIVHVSAPEGSDLLGLQPFELTWCGFPVPDAPKAALVVCADSASDAADGPEEIRSATLSSTENLTSSGWLGSGSTVAGPANIVVSGAAVETGAAVVVGKEISAWIDARRGGAGELTAQCARSEAGGNSVPAPPPAHCALYAHGDGTFTLSVRPRVPGHHHLTVKWSGIHVRGSPFGVRAVGAPDASRVRVLGPGVRDGVLATYRSVFTCETRGAGAGQLTVRVRGPKGAFRVEMQRESQKDRTILCKYDPTEPGDYRIEVRWAGQHVPGSPFRVAIFDTLDELRQHQMQQQQHSIRH